MDDPSDSCDPNRGGAACPGICVPRPEPPLPIPCGGFAGKPCPNNTYLCVDKPSDSCDPQKGGADCPGNCVPLPKLPPAGTTTNSSTTLLTDIRCGGFTGKRCPSKDYIYVENPNDHCSDCMGVSVPRKHIVEEENQHEATRSLRINRIHPKLGTIRRMRV